MSGDIVDSYDPRRWVADWTPSALRASPAARNGLDGRVRAASAGVAILLVGAGLAWFARAPVPQAGQAPVAQQKPAETNQVRRTFRLERAADLQSALVSSGLAPAVAQAVASAALPALKPEGEIRAVLVMIRDGAGLVLERLEASNGDSSGVVVRRDASGNLSASAVAAQVSVRIMVKHGTMNEDSFYSSAVAVGLPNSLIPAFAKALAFDFDFQREVSAGDAFEAAYAQSVNADGEAVGAPTLLYAALTTAKKSATVYSFSPDGKTEEWFDASGRNIVRILMRTPVDGARVTSSFGMRFHPILKFAKLHGGIDFAAPVGTPIYAAGSGTIEFAAEKGPNGNLVIIQHDNGWQTYYLHLNRFADGIMAGTRISQGQQIGEVGTTGRSTGPHLHYEVHIDGERVDPSEIQTEAGQTLEGEQLIAFEATRDRIDISRAEQSF